MPHSLASGAVRAAPSLLPLLNLLLASPVAPAQTMLASVAGGAPAMLQPGLASPTRGALFPRSGRLLSFSKAGPHRRGWRSAARAAERAAAAPPYFTRRLQLSAAAVAAAQAAESAEEGAPASSSRDSSSSSSSRSRDSSNGGTFLSELYIKDFALVAEQRLRLERGLNVITGGCRDDGGAVLAKCCVFWLRVEGGEGHPACSKLNGAEWRQAGAGAGAGGARPGRPHVSAPTAGALALFLHWLPCPPAGESGAGKSVLVEALGQILGGTAFEEAVRAPAGGCSHV